MSTNEPDYKSLFTAAVRALAEIDVALGMPDDGTNSPEKTITAIKLLHSMIIDHFAEIERLNGEILKLKACR